MSLHDRLSRGSNPVARGFDPLCIWAALASPRLASQTSPFMHRTAKGDAAVMPRKPVRLARNTGMPHAPAGGSAAE